MYAVAYFNTPGPRPTAVFPNVFPDFDMAVDCVIYQIKSDHDDIVCVGDLDIDPAMPGNSVITWENSTYVISKLFNFNPKGM